MIRLLLFLIFCGAVCRTAAQVPFTRDVWLNDAGTPVKVNTLMLDEQGWMWLGTDNGLLRFNGRTAIAVANSSRAVTSIAVLNGLVFYGCRDGGIYRYDGRQRVQLAATGSAVLSLLITPYGLLGGTEGAGLYYLGGGKTLHFTAQNGLPDDYVYSMAAEDSTLFIATDKGIFQGKVNDGNGLHFSELVQVKDIARIVRFDYPELWMGMQERGVDNMVTQWRPSADSLLGTDNWLWGQVNDICPVGAGEAWIVTDEGWLIHAGFSADKKQKNEVFSPVLNLKRKINAITIDRSGNMWLATTSGLTLVTEPYLQKISLGADFSLSKLSALACDHQNTIWFTQNNELREYDPATSEVTTAWHSPAPVNCLYVDSSGILWIGTSGHGIMYRTGDGAMHPVIGADTLAGEHILSIAGNSQQLWVSSLNGVDELLLQPDGTHHITRHHGKRSGIGSDYVYHIFKDSKGRVWFATDGAGITMLEHGQYRNWKGPDGFASEVIYSITEDAAGNIWAAALDDGLFCYDGKKWKQFTRKAGLMDKTPFTVAANRSGQVLAVTAKGIDVWYPHDQEFRHINRRNGLGIDSTSSALNAFAIDTSGNVYIPYQGGLLVGTSQEPGISIRPVVHITGLFCYDGKKWKQFTRKAGLMDKTPFTVAANRSGQVLAVTAKGIDVWYPHDQEFRHINRRNGLGIDSTSSALNAFAIDTSGNVYIPYQGGLLVGTSQEPGISIRPVVHITGVSLFLKNLEKDQRFFEADQNYLTFRFEGINYAHMERLRYRYRLEGFNNDWIQTTDESITYPRLPSGDYRFCVQASMHETFEHAASDVYTFSIGKPLWRQWYFWLLIISGIGGAIWLLMRWRVQSLQKVAQLKHERMTFEYEHLKSQVNPHFLFNSLNTLASLIEEDKDAAVNYTVQLSDMYRETLSFRERDLVPLAEEWQVLERYFYIQQSRFGAALQLRSSVPETIKQSKKVVPLALQILMENAVKHNVVSRTAPLIIFISVEGEMLIVRNEIRPKTNSEKGTGLGLKNIRQRYALLTQKEVQWYIRNNEFVVSIPLL